MTEPTTIVELSEDLIGQDPELLKQALLAALSLGRPVAVLSDKVGRAGTATLQLLLAFTREARSKGIPVQLHAPSPALLDAIACAGLRHELAPAD